MPEILLCSLLSFAKEMLNVETMNCRSSYGTTGSPNDTRSATNLQISRCEADPISNLFRNRMRPWFLSLLLSSRFSFAVAAKPPIPWTRIIQSPPPRSLPSTKGPHRNVAVTLRGGGGSVCRIGRRNRRTGSHF